MFVILDFMATCVLGRKWIDDLKICVDGMRKFVYEIRKFDKVGVHILEFFYFVFFGQRTIAEPMH